MIAPILVLGPMASGKTSFCKRLYGTMKSEGINPFALVEENLRNAKGIPTELWYSELTTGERRFLGRRADSHSDVSPFIFNQTAFTWACERIHTAVHDGYGALILDELGPLELKQHGGILPALDWALNNAPCPIVLTLRPDLEAALVKRLSVPSACGVMRIALGPNPRENEDFSIVQAIIRHCQEGKGAV